GHPRRTALQAVGGDPLGARHRPGDHRRRHWRHRRGRHRAGAAIADRWAHGTDRPAGAGGALALEGAGAANRSRCRYCRRAHSHRRPSPLSWDGRRKQKMKWITRERVKVDRVACPWLIKKFVDPQAEFLFVPTDQVAAVAQREGAIPYDVGGVELGHHGVECSFDAIVKKYNVTDPAVL